jgi:hypothetical protein
LFFFVLLPSGLSIFDCSFGILWHLFPIDFCNCSDSVIFLVFHIIPDMFIMFPVSGLSTLGCPIALLQRLFSTPFWYALKYSQTCIKRSSLEQRKSVLIRQVSF